MTMKSRVYIAFYWLVNIVPGPDISADNPRKHRPQLLKEFKEWFSGFPKDDTAVKYVVEMIWNDGSDFQREKTSVVYAGRLHLFLCSESRVIQKCLGFREWVTFTNSLHMVLVNQLGFCEAPTQWLKDFSWFFNLFHSLPTHPKTSSFAVNVSCAKLFRLRRVSARFLSFAWLRAESFRK